MSKHKLQQPYKKAEVSIIRSSAAEYLTFVASSGQGGVEAVYADENVWITQKMMGLLYSVDVRTINYHLKNVFSSNELEEDSVIRNIRITAADGKFTTPSTTSLLGPLLLATRLTPSARYSSASGQPPSSKSSPSRATRWMTSA
jgi:hypothetical protein